MNRARLSLAAIVLSTVLLAGLAAGVQPAHASVPGDCGGWSWLYPQPQGQNLQAVDFVDAQHGWAAGGGNVLATTDGGVTWAGVQIMPVGLVVAVSFVDDLNGWALGYTMSGGPNDPVVARTTDGGKTWVKLGAPAVSAGSDLRDISFGDLSTGVIVGQRGVCFRTTDGGEHWAAVSVGNNAYLNAVGMSSAQDGWAAGAYYSGTYSPLLWHTTNGGATWTPQNPGVTSGDLTCLSVLSDTTAVAGGWDGDTSPSYACRTTDGGATWTPISTSWSTLVSGFVNNCDWVTGVAFATADDGWVTVNDDLNRTATSGTAYGSGKVFATTDGSQTWTDQTPSGDLYLEGGAMSCASPSAAWLAGSDMSEAHASITGTSDGGTTWTPCGVGWGQFPVLGFAATGSTLCGVSWGGSGGAAITSSDGGATWSRGSITPAPSQSPLDLDGITFSSPTHGWAVGGGPAGGVAETTDGGRTWAEQIVTPAGGGGWLSSVSFVSDDEGWVAGRAYGSDSPCVYHTVNGGGYWAPETLPDDIQTQTPTSIEFSDSSHGWLLTDAGWVLQTVDGGTDWTVFAEGIGGGKFRAQTWLDSQHGWLVGDDGDVLRTTDGGLDWSYGQVFPQYPVTGVAFGDAMHGWATSGTLVYATSDGGATWRIQGVSDDVQVEGIAAMSASHAYLWGTGWLFGAVLETTTGGQNPDDTTPPTLSLGKAAGTWFNHDVTVSLVASDASGIMMEFVGLDDAQAGQDTAITVPTSAGQGMHTATGVAIDNAGNGSAPVSVSVGIDTQAPTKTWTINRPTVARGKTTTLKYHIYDPLPGCDKAKTTLVIYNAKETRVVKKVSLGTVAENKDLSYRYRCTLPRGRYWWGVKATDIAGNVCKNVWVWTLTVK